MYNKKRRLSGRGESWSEATLLHLTGGLSVVLYTDQTPYVAYRVHQRFEYKKSTSRPQK